MHFKGVAIVFSLTAFIAGFIFHSPIPAKVPDQLVFQALVDVLSFSETMVSNLITSVTICNIVQCKFYLNYKQVNLLAFSEFE